MKKILMILYKFPPSNDVGAFRPLKFINHLNKFGWKPIVLAPSNGVYFSYDVDLEKTVRGKCRIYRIPMFFPFRKSDGLRSTKFKPIKQLLWRIWNKLALPDGALLWLPPVIRAASQITQKHHIDLIFVSGPPFSIFLGACYLRRKIKKKLIVDYRDSWAFNPFHPVSIIRRLFEKQLDKFVLRSSDAIIFATEDLRRLEIEGLKMSWTDQKSYTITNSFEPNSQTKAGNPLRKKFVVVHAGNLFRSRNPKVLFQGLSIAASLDHDFANHTKFIFYGVFDYKKFDGMCHHLGINTIVSLKPRIPQKQLFPQLKQASALLLINSYGPNHHIFIPAKFFDYLNAGRPILCLSENGALTRIIQETRSGVVVDPRNPVAIARCILRMFDQIHLRKTPFFIDHKKIAAYESYQTTKYLADICDNVISRRFPNG